MDYERATGHHGIAVLEGLIRKHRPMLVVEAGTYPGQATASLLEALERNGQGHLITFEPDDAYFAEMQLVFGDSCEVIRGNPDPNTIAQADFLYLDSAPYLRRLAEVELWNHIGKPGSVCVVDDANDTSWQNDIFEGWDKIHEGHGLWIKIHD